MDLSRVSRREALEPQREPYWHRLRPGCLVGYRPSARGGSGTWIARAYDEEQLGYRFRTLRAFGEHPASARIALAKQASEEFALQVERGAVVEEQAVTVSDACRRFAKSRPEAEQRFRRYVYADPIAKVKLVKLRRSHLESWRDRMKNTPALVSRRKSGKPITRQRSPATLNRDMAVLRTALGSVLALGAPNTDGAWQEALRPIRNAVRSRTLYLSLEQHRALIDAVAPEAEPFVRALCLLPLRPGAVAALTAGEFDRRTSELTVGKDKAGAGRRIVVPKAAARHFATAAKGKPPTALLFTRSNDSPWDRNSWKIPIAEAAGLPLLTVAQISGTSAEMIEHHYGHLMRHAAIEALATLTL